MSGAQRTGYDSIVVGGGHNGLTCAAYLARRGRRVLVLEAAERLGGAAVTRTFAPGFSVSACAHLLHLMPPTLMRELALERHGLRLAGLALPTVALAADGPPLVLGGAGPGSLGSRAPADAAALERWQSLFGRFAAALHPVLARTPPRLGSDDWHDAYALLGLGWRLRRLG
ncbi:MAG: NAD(P)/FAD-dependent oxidoreductase, partial [Gammaproteobacteria bacterium]|nr:NAD(P)/FAD-dependent oxidoreductase [Gammaproteobacteria bacterium]